MSSTPLSTNTAKHINVTDTYSAHNYSPLPVVLNKGKGAKVWDVDGKCYFDFLAGYSSLNQGHCHPRLLEVFTKQAAQLTLTSRAFHSDQFAPYVQYMHGLFGYDKLLPMNTGAEAVETAIKLVRRWGYRVKGVANQQAKIIVCNENFHGRTVNIVSFSTDDASQNDFGPFTPGYIQIPYNDLRALENALKDSDVVGFLVEPIQGEAGVIVPEDGFLSKAFALCKAYNVLFIADEIQTGIGRTGKMLACDHEGVKPDVVILGKALSGGFMPVSAVLSSNEVMDLIEPGSHGSTFGGNPLACAVAVEALKVIVEENLAENAATLGVQFRQALKDLENPYIVDIRGKGLLNAIEIQHSNENAAYDLCVELMKNGLLAKPTHGNKIRFSPPLVITKSELEEALLIIKKSLDVLN
jgi:ornithine--oxo-acid transaminase